MDVYILSLSCFIMRCYGCGGVDRGSGRDPCFVFLEEMFSVYQMSIVVVDGKACEETNTTWSL